MNRTKLLTQENYVQIKKSQIRLLLEEQSDQGLFVLAYSGLKLRVTKNNFLIYQPNICCGYSKEPSQRVGSFQYPKHMLKIMGKKIFTILC